MLHIRVYSFPHFFSSGIWSYGGVNDMCQMTLGNKGEERVLWLVWHPLESCQSLLDIANLGSVSYIWVQSLSRVWLFATPWTAARQASLSITNSWSSPKLMSIESVMPSSHLILCCPLFLLPPIPPSIGVFSNESTLRMRWPKYWSFSFSIIPSKEHPRLISFRMDWLDLLVTTWLMTTSAFLYCVQAFPRFFPADLGYWWYNQLPNEVICSPLVFFFGIALSFATGDYLGQVHKLSTHLSSTTLGHVATSGFLYSMPHGN